MSLSRGKALSKVDLDRDEIWKVPYFVKCLVDIQGELELLRTIFKINRNQIVLTPLQQEFLRQNKFGRRSNIT
jgi:hypothetical protein